MESSTVYFVLFLSVPAISMAILTFDPFWKTK